MKLVSLLFAYSWLLLVPASGADAQTAQHAALRDSLAGIADVPLLYRMERSGGAGGGAEAVMRRGLIALRIYELTEDPADAGRSREIFEGGVARFPGDAWLHYGHALALAYGPEIRLHVPTGVLDGVTLGQSVAEIFGRDPRSHARRSLLRALELDASFGAAAVLLADLAVADGGRHREHIEEARDALRSVHAAGGVTPATARSLAQLETRLGNYAAAGAAVRAAGTTTDPGALHEEAVALLLQADQVAAGAAAYWRGVEHLDAAAAPAYYTAVEVLATPQEAADWEVADIAGRRLWLHRFWEGRAAEAGVTVAERLEEHYRRLTAARMRYVRNSMRGADGTGLLLSPEENERYPFDDRGVVLIRHGEPLAVVHTGQRGVLPNESWAYELPGHGPQLFHFVALRGTQSFSLVSNLLEALDRTPMLDSPEVLNQRARAVIALIADRTPYEPRYRALLGRFRQTLEAAPGQSLDNTELRSMLETADAEYRRGARTALKLDTHTPDFTGDLPFAHDVFTFRTAEARTALTAAFALPARLLQPRISAAGAEYAVKVSVILVDTLIDVVTRIDTVQHLRHVSALAPDDHIRTHVTLPVLPSEHTIYRVVAEDAVSGRGRVESGGDVVRDYTGSALTISDIVLAHPDSDGAGDWQRGDMRLDFALPRAFAPERPFTVFYELYNLPADRGYNTRITVERADGGGIRSRLRSIFGGGGNAVDVSFDDVARTDALGHVQESRELAGDLPAGRYRMEITVTTQDGETTRTETEFTVVE